jgi:Protein of unknown function DUF262
MNTNEPLKRLQLRTTNRPIEVIKHWQSEGYLNLSPPYQRGDVWGLIRQRNLIRSILMGIPIPSLIINDRFAAGCGEEIAVIDGKQRMTAILKFLSNELEIPSIWILEEDIGMVSFDLLPIPQQRGIKSMTIGIAEGSLKTLEEEIEVFELVNFSGVPQGETDIL